MPDEWQPAAEWHALGDAYYRRTTEYEMLWPMQRLDQFLVASSSDGGLIGTLCALPSASARPDAARCRRRDGHR